MYTEKQKTIFTKNLPTFYAVGESIMVDHVY